MSVAFNAALSQYLAIAAPRPELNGLTSFTLCVWLGRELTASGESKAISFSTGTAASSNRLGIGATVDFGPLEVRSSVRRTDGGSELTVSTTPQFLARQGNMFTSIMGGTSTRIWKYQNVGWGNAGTGGGGLISATSSLAAAIGARADGTAEFFDGLVEEIRLYDSTFGLVPNRYPDLTRVQLMRGRDLRSFMHPNLKLWWKLKGSGTVTVNTDKISGVTATAETHPFTHVT